jgi:predicted nucleic acid-binding protein
VLDRRDEWHGRVLAAWPELIDRCITTEAVLTEAAHLTGGRGHSARPLEFVLAAAVPIVPLSVEAYRRCAVLLRQYGDLPMDFADATLVTLADVLETERVFTLDRRGFRTYRTATGQPFELFPG